MMTKLSNRAPAEGVSRREKISAAMKRKWQEKEYREKTLKSISARGWDIKNCLEAQKFEAGLMG